MPLTGDFGELRQLGNRLDRFNFSKVTKAVGGESAVQYSADFAAQRDPWGDAWSNKSGKAPVNRLSGQLASPSLSVGGATIRLRLESYWVFRQVGANGATPTALLPFGNIEATVWAVPMIDEAADVIEKQLGKRP
ncbi:MAG: hypothetical protein ACRCU1_03420 [Alsobacter sp.]